MSTKDTINLLMSVDDNFYKPFLVALYSICSNTCGKVRLFFIGHLNTKQLQEIKKITKVAEITIINDKQNEFKVLQFAKSTSTYPLCSLYRIVSPFLVQDIDRLLWIDADVVVRKDISLIYNYDLKGKAIGAIADSTKRVAELHNIHGYRINKYFFSGLLVFDIAKIKRIYSLSLIEGVIEKVSKDTFFPDQDILNVVYANDVEYIPEYYNQILIWNKFNDVKIDKNEFVIYHFAGDVKPWQKEFYNFKNARLYWDYGNKVYSFCFRFKLFFKSRFFFVKKVLYKLFSR